MDNHIKKENPAQGKNDFYSLTVEPINSSIEALEKGNYTHSYIWGRGINVPEPQQGAVGSKNIYFIPITEDIPLGAEAVYLQKLGFRPSGFGFNYMLGTMAQFPAGQLPEAFHGKKIVALDNLIAISDSRIPAFFIVDCTEGGRELGFQPCLYGHHVWGSEHKSEDGGEKWLFVAEEI